MDPFIQMRTKINAAEATRQVLNKSIDLLHKLSHHKITKSEVNKELSSILSHYFFSFVIGREVMDDHDKLQLELLLNQAYDVTSKVEEKKVPLYEAIMMMNKVVMGQPPVAPKCASKSAPIEQEELQSASMQQDLFRDEIVEEEIHFIAPRVEEGGVEDLMGEVIRQKNVLEQSIIRLNSALHEIGFELTPKYPK